MATQRTDLFGRTVIYTDVEEITSENLFEVLEDAVDTHETNQTDIEYLFAYFKGDQPINSRTKTYNTDINNMIVENRAKEIVDFKTGYLVGEPIQYIGRGEVDSETIKALNDLMTAENKDAVDTQVVENQNICGTAYKICLPDTDFDITDDEGIAPFEQFSLDPAQTFVIYSSGIDHKPMAGVYAIEDSNEDLHYTIYTPTKIFKTLGTDSIESTEANPLGMIPIIEYPANEARLGAFEPVISLLDAINTVDSNRLDGVEQFIQALLVLTNCDLDDDTTATTIKEKGILNLKATGDFEQKAQILASELNQVQTQTLKDDLYQTVLTICALPNRNGGSSTSDTGIAVVYRDGWSAAETAAKKQEMEFKKSERAFLKVAIKIANTLLGSDFKSSDVDIKFTRRNYENIETKAKVLIEMLNNPYLDKKLGFVYCNMFADPEEAYRSSLPYIEQAMNSEEESNGESGS